MRFIQNVFGIALLMDKAGDGGTAGGGAGDGKGAKEGGDGGSNTVTLTKEQFDALQARIEKLESKAKGVAGGTNDDDPDLEDRARKEREANAKKKGDQKALEAALRFSLQAENFLKQNASLLPKDAADIFKAADKENFEDAVAKDRAIKSGLIKSFFQVQSNLDLLTAYQKSTIEEWLNMTNNGRQERAGEIWESIFEPTLEMLRKIKKAEALNKGFGTGDDNAYKAKLEKLARQHYLGERVQ